MTADAGDRPNLLLFGVGHSGTSVVAKMLQALGWNLGEADGFAENVPIRQLNAQILGGRSHDTEKMTAAIAQLLKPWLVKDPRFVLTLGAWTPIFAEQTPAERPTLLFLTRELAKIERTYSAYGELHNGAPGMYRKTVRELVEHAVEGYRNWPFAKIQVEFEQVIEAGTIFNVKRAKRRDDASQGSV